MLKSNQLKIVLYVCLFIFFMSLLCRLYRKLYIESFTIPNLEANMALIQLAKEQNDLLEEDSEDELIDSSGEIQKLMIDTTSAVDKINYDIENEESIDDDYDDDYDETTDETLTMNKYINS